ncbi:MAG: hypothetical protein QG658_8 [Patescibacteria group bacterium]|jgi:uncharacterized SAM-binding protein YcdF (DUF218 family)|nr:hypothetical protein [Patescibacteria group bacterium]
MIFHRKKEKKRRSRTRKFIGFLVGLFFLLGLFAAAVFGSAIYLSPQDSTSPADAIVVVSGGQTQTRAKHGIELYKKDLAPKIVFSGAALDDGPSNAREMAALARRSGVPEEAIVIDEDAKTTYENAVNTKRILEESKAKSLILVTSPYHQRRAFITFTKILGDGFSIENSSSYDNAWSKSAWWATPFGVWITGSELAKVGYIYATGNYQ